MRLIGHLIVRLVQIAIGLCLALYSASLVLVLSIETGILASGSNAAGMETGVVLAVGSLVGALFIGVYIAPIVAAPAAVAILVAEAARLRGLVANLLLGAAVAAGTGWLARGDATAETSGSIAVLAAGFAGGFVYWAVAGRSAGSWWSGDSPAAR